MPHKIFTRSLTCSVALYFALFAAPAQADNFFATQNETLQRSLEDLRARCHADIKASIDVKSFTRKVETVDERQASNLGSHCAKPLRALTAWCAAGFGQSMGEDMSSYVCRFAEGPSQTSLKQGVLTVTTPWDKNGSAWEKTAKLATGSVLRVGAFNANQAALIKNAEARIKDTSADMQRRCQGYALPWSVDWQSFLPLVDEHAARDPSYAIWQECYEPLRAVELRCNHEQADLVKAQIESVVCRYQKNKASSFTLEKGVLSLQTDMKQRARAFYTDHLGDLLRDGDFSARQTDFIKDENTNFQRVFSENVDRDCKTSIAWEIDWKSFKGEISKRLNQEETTSIYDRCGVPLHRLVDVCLQSKKVAGKVKKKVKSFRCRFGGKRKGKLALKKGRLDYRVDFSVKDPYAKVDRFLVKKRILKKRPPPKKLSSSELQNIRRILGDRGDGRTQCRRACGKRCRYAPNRSQCLSRCRGDC